MNKQIITAIVVIVVVLLGGLFASRQGGAREVVDESANKDTQAPDGSPLDDMIHVFDPSDGVTVYSPIDVFGEARGTWFFEGSFLVQLYDGEGNLLSEGVASSTSDWMTEDFVPFEASLSYQEPVKTETGTLVLIRDNPSGDPANDMQAVVPVRFDSVE